jgi:50S ribosomal protein L16 3-hydroxylase
MLGNRSPRDFLRRYWQKRMLFVRDAVPQFAGVVDERALAVLARRDDVESRIVERGETRHGPFKRVSLRKSGSTLLVNGVNLHVRAADALLQRFNFVPQARLDDVMVSYATPGGGVGPHVDSYDVFLLQGPGRRRWKVWLSGNQTREYVLGPGDMLYLPPGVKHDGVALDPCFTYSIGFRTPRGAELGAAFLDWLHERGLPDAVYRDPGLRPTSHAGKIPAEMFRFARKHLSKIRWSGEDVADFLGRYLSTPKSHVVFLRSSSKGALARLDGKTQLLYSGDRFFINGEALQAKGPQARALRKLADERVLLAAGPLAGLISGWQKLGWLHLERP